jgi:hypothetical protein
VFCAAYEHVILPSAQCTEVICTMVAAVEAEIAAAAAAMAAMVEELPV